MDYQGVTAPVAVTFKGGTVEQMKPYSDSLRAYMAAQTDLMKWVHSDFDEYISTVEVDMDTDEAARLGINRTLLSLSLSGIFNGQTIATVWEGNDAVPVTLYSDSVTDDMSYDTVENQIGGRSARLLVTSSFQYLGFDTSGGLAANIYALKVSMQKLQEYDRL